MSLTKQTWRVLCSARTASERALVHAKRGLFVGALLMAGLLAGCGPSADWLDLDGNGYRHDDLRGNWVVINYWATWCAPCIEEIPELISLGERHENIAVFGVNFDAPEGKEAVAQARKMGITFPVLTRDPHLDFGFPRPQVLPTTVIVTPNGEIHATLVGPQTEASLLAAISGVPSQAD